ncbi:21171_t:CDS:2, partial [Cetraspora pellucida]
GEGLSEKENKKELVERLADRVLSKAKGKDRVVDGTQGRNVGEGRMGFDAEEGLHDNIARNRSLDNVDGKGTGSEGAGYAGYGGYLDFDQQYVALEKSIEKTMKAMLGKVVGEIRKSIQPYDEWCKVERYMDSAILSNDWDMISKAREVVVMRAFVLRIANREGWNIAAEIGDKSSNDPMEAFFHDKLTRMAVLAPNQGIQWPLIQPFQPVQPYQSVQSLQSGFSPGVGPFFSGVPQVPYQVQERQAYDNQIRGHIIQDCPQKKTNQFFHGSSSKGEGSCLRLGGREYTERSRTKRKE